MNYLSRLALQSGLLESPGRWPARPEALEIVETVELPSTEAPGAEEALPPSPAMQPPVPSPPVFEKAERPPSPIDQRMDVPPAAPMPAPAKTKQPRNETAPPVPAPVVDGVKLPDMTETSAPDAPRPSESAREMRIRQVLEWVATNERPPPQDIGSEPPTTRQSDPPATTEAPRATQRSRFEPPDIPFLEITQPAGAQEAPADPSPAAGRTASARDRQSAAPPESSIVEEHIDISIGAIRLEVTPPPASAAVKRAPPAAAAPLPSRAPDPSPTSRLRRRFIRV